MKQTKTLITVKVITKICIEITEFHIVCGIYYENMWNSSIRRLPCNVGLCAATCSFVYDCSKAGLSNSSINDTQKILLNETIHTCTRAHTSAHHIEILLCTKLMKLHSRNWWNCTHETEALCTLYLYELPMGTGKLITFYTGYENILIYLFKWCSKKCLNRIVEVKNCNIERKTNL